MRHTGIATALTLAALLVACGGSTSPTGNVTVADLAGTWTASKWEYTAGSQQLDLVSGGGHATLTATSSGGYNIVGTYLGVDFTVSGTWSVSGGNLIIDDDVSGPETDPFTLSGNTLTVTSADNNWDFGSGEVTAKLVMVFTR